MQTWRAFPCVSPSWVRFRAAAATAWPRAMPPSLGGTRWCQYGRKPAWRRRADRPLDQDPVLEAAAGENDRGSPIAPGHRDDRFRQGGVESRARSRRCKPVLDVVEDSPDHRAPSRPRNARLSARRVRCSSSRNGYGSTVVAACTANSSSMAAWPSKPAIWRSPASEATASKRRPALRGHGRVDRPVAASSSTRASSRPA